MDPSRVRGAAGEPGQPVRGRDVELTALAAHLDQLRSGIGTVALVEGGAGMGKSRLLDEVATMARRLSIRVGSGVAEPCDTVVQLSALMDALFDGPSPILERAALRDAHTSPEQRYWLLQDLEALLERAALEAPLLVCLDDMQWADSGTAAALRTLPARLATVPVAWVIALRPGQGSRQLRGAVDWLEGNRAEKIVLGPLDQDGIAQVAADVLVAEPDSAVLKMAEQAGGSPFLLVELLSGLREEKLVQIESGRAELVEERLPHRVSESMRRRLERMSDPARQVATVASALGRKFSLDDLGAMLGLSPSALLAPVEELIHADLLVERDDKLAFGHDLIREAVRASVPLPARRALDRQAAAVLLADGALPVEVATQLAASAGPGDDVAITTLFKAAEALGTTDPGAAADLSQRALELAPRNMRCAGPLVAQTAVWLHAAARGEEAKSFADTALRQVLPAEQEAEVHLSIAGMFAISPDVRAEACRQALALPGLPEHLRARHLALFFHNLANAGRIDEARAQLEGAVAAVRKCQASPGSLFLNLPNLASHMPTGASRRHWSWWRPRSEPVWALAMTQGCTSPASGVATCSPRSTGSMSHSRCRRRTSPRLSATGRAGRSPCTRPDAGGNCSSWGASPTRRPSLRSTSPWMPPPGRQRAGCRGSRCSRARRAAYRRPGPGTQATEIAQVMLSQSAPSVRRHAAWLLALQAMADGDPPGAHRWLCALGEDERTSILPLFPMDVTDEPRLIHIALAARDRELAVSAADSAQRRSALSPGVRSLAAAAAHTDGLLNHSQRGLAEAVELFEGGSRPMALAAALEDLGVVAVEDGATPEAVDALGRALEIYAQTGAAWDAGRVRSRLRALGVRRRLVSERHPGNGWASMTDSELAWRDWSLRVSPTAR